MNITAQQIISDEAQALINDYGALAQDLLTDYDGDVWEVQRYIEENYQGMFDSFMDFAVELAQDMLPITDKRDDLLSRYFDYEKWARDLQHDYLEYPVREGARYGSVHVIRRA